MNPNRAQPSISLGNSTQSQAQAAARRTVWRLGLIALTLFAGFVLRGVLA